MKRTVISLFFVFTLACWLPYANAANRYDGNWSGDTSDGKEFSFVIENDQIKSVTIKLLICKSLPISTETACGKTVELHGGHCVSGEITSSTSASSHRISEYELYEQITITTENCFATVGGGGTFTSNLSSADPLLSECDVENDGTFSVSIDIPLSYYPAKDSLSIKISGDIQNDSASGKMEQTWINAGENWTETNDDIKWTARNDDYVQQYCLVIDKEGTGNGTVKTSPEGISCGIDCLGKYEKGTLINLTATPDSNSVFSGWTGENCSGTGDCTITINKDATVTASFEQKYTLTVKKDGWGSGTIKSDPEGINCGTDCSEKYGQGTKVTLTAVPDEDHHFSGWTGGICSGTGTCTVTVSSDVTVTGIFEKKSESDDNDGGSGCFINSCGYKR